MSGPEWTPGRQPVSRGPQAPRSSMLDLEFAHLSDVGKIRDHNEDYVGHFSPATTAQVRSHGWLFALADGVGGHQQGEVASRTAVETLIAEFSRSSRPEPYSSALPSMVQAANAAVVQAGLAAGPGGAGMATTIVACAIRYDRATVAHVGDSRCYLIRSGKPRLITSDHTVANEQVKLGILSREEAGETSTRHVLSRSLGAELFVNVEVNEIALLAGDVLLLCCDGLHGAISDSAMAAIVAQNTDLRTAAQELVHAANECDGSDNISVQLIRIRSVERVGMYRGRPYKLR